EGISRGDLIHYTATGTGGTRTTTGVVLQVMSTTLLVSNPNSLFQPANPSNFTVDVYQQLSGVTFLLKFAPTLSPSTNLNFNLGVPFLNVNADAQVNFVGNLTLLLGFGLNKQDGFFLKTKFNDVPMISAQDASAPELSLHGQVNVSGSLGLALGFLHLD